MNTQELDAKYVLPTYARSALEIKSAKGASVEDVDGKKYIDFTAGIGVVSVGHANERLSKALCKQLEKITHISNLFYITPQVNAAKKVVETLGMDMQCFFGNSGAEANECAIKIARKYGERDESIKRYKIITLEHSFHGRTITTVKACGQESMHNYFGPFPDGFVYASSLDEIESLLDEYTAGVMIELIQGEGGVEPQNREKVQNLAKLLQERGIPLIVDEVQTGAYRTGAFSASQLYGIKPQIISLAKGVGGGIPVGITLTSLQGVFSAGDHGSTFGGNYLSSVAVCEVMDILNEKQDKGELQESSKLFNTALDTFYEEHKDVFIQRVGIGMMCGLRVKDASTLTAIIQNARENGLLVLKAGRNTLRFLPPLTITKEEIDEGFKALRTTMHNL